MWSSACIALLSKEYLANAAVSEATPKTSMANVVMSMLHHLLTGLR